MSAAESPTPRCSVSLVGADGDLDRLAKHFDDMNVGWIRRDAQSGWVLSSVQMEDTAKAEDVRRLARAIIAHQDRVMYVVHQGYKGVSVGDPVSFVREDGSRVFNVGLSDTLTFRVNKWHLGIQPIDPHVVARAAKEDPTMARLLKWAHGLEGDWMDLYNFAEAIGKSLPRPSNRLDGLRYCVGQGWISRQEAKAFERSANIMRHPVGAEEAPMSLSAGQSLMRRVATKLILYLIDRPK